MTSDGAPGALTGRAVVVVGASSGIGAATAHAVAAAGALVGALARRADRLDELVAALPGSGHAAATADVTEPAALAAALDDVVGRLAVPVTGVVAAAGVMSRPGPATARDRRRVRRVVGAPTGIPVT